MSTTSTSNPTTDALIAHLTTAVRARKDSLIALRARIVEWLDPIPVGTVLADESGEVCRIIRVCTGASQWATQMWDVTIKGTGALSADGKLLCEDLDSSYFDGHNMHNRSIEPTCRYAHGEAGDTLAYEPGSRVRELAARLPVAIARYVATCATERAANDDATARL